MVLRALRPVEEISGYLSGFSVLRLVFLRPLLLAFTLLAFCFVETWCVLEDIRRKMVHVVSDLPIADLRYLFLQVHPFHRLVDGINFCYQQRPDLLNHVSSIIFVRAIHQVSRAA